GAVSLNRRESDRLFERLHRHEVDARPIAFIGSRVGVSLPFHLRKSHHLLFVSAVVVADEIALLHRAKIVASREIPDTGPRGAGLFDDCVPGIRFGLLLDDPIIARHWVILTRARRLCKPRRWSRESMDGRAYSRAVRPATLFDGSRGRSPHRNHFHFARAGR